MGDPNSGRDFRNDFSLLPTRAFVALQLRTNAMAVVIGFHICHRYHRPTRGQKFVLASGAVPSSTLGHGRV